MRIDTPLSTEAGNCWQTIEEFDTCDPVVDGLAEDYFATVVQDFIGTGRGSRGRIGNAESVLVPARAITQFAVDWLQSSAKQRSSQPASTDETQSK